MAQGELYFSLSLPTTQLLNYSSLIPSTIRKGRPDHQKEEKCPQWKVVAGNFPGRKIHTMRKPVWRHWNQRSIYDRNAKTTGQTTWCNEGLDKLTRLLSPSVTSNSFVTPWTVPHQAPLSMGFSRQEYWSRFPFPPPGDLPDPGIKPMSPASSALASGFFLLFYHYATWEVQAGQVN